MIIPLSKCSPSGELPKGVRGQVKENSALSVHGTYEENGTHDTGLHPSECWKGGRGAAG